MNWKRLWEGSFAAKWRWLDLVLTLGWLTLAVICAVRSSWGWVVVDLAGAVSFGAVTWSEWKKHRNG